MEVLLANAKDIRTYLSLLIYVRALKINGIVFVLYCVVFDETSNFLIYPTMMGIKGSTISGVGC